MLPMPETISSRASGASATYQLRVQPTLEHFRGHFPGFPILPGIVQLDWAVQFGRRHFEGLGESTGVDNFKCQALVFPDAELTLELRRDETGLHFRYFDAQRTYSSGKILFADRKPA
jgi:3-hydroxymyristoyl/3-hydroxydecanoyl-(acyl carrier protein) dehydratase